MVVTVYKNSVALPAIGMAVLFTVDGDQTYVGSFENGIWFDSADVDVCNDKDSVVYWANLDAVDPRRIYLDYDREG